MERNDQTGHHVLDADVGHQSSPLELLRFLGISVAVGASLVKCRMDLRWRAAGEVVSSSEASLRPSGNLPTNDSGQD